MIPRMPRTPHLFRAACSRPVTSVALLVSVALAPGLLLVGCGAQSNASQSTDTGNPPAIDEHALHVTEGSAGNVVVSADVGGVSPAGATVLVSNEQSGAEADTTVKEDGSFSVTLPGGVDDEYAVAVKANGETEQLVLGSSAPAEPGLGDIVGQRYLLESATGFSLVKDTQLSISFDETSFTFNAGCNGHFGEYTFCDGSLCMAGMGSTDIGCGQELQSQDQWLADFFTSTPQLEIDGDQLTVEGTDATLVFLDREVANPDRPLTGRTWTVDTFIRGGGASNRPLPKDPTLTFNANGTLSVFAGCNTGSGNFEVNGTELTLTELFYTEIGCTDEATGTAEADVQEVMHGGTLSIEIEAARLTLMRGDVGLGAITE